ncbi:MAG: DUF4231 domain-containing protein [Vagococcus sp.]|uniref:DUF4231 domain-containing protein n=1 Tax=Vagococcus sp. TaxID=1933889 RepID=UPI002FC6CD20
MYDNFNYLEDRVDKQINHQKRRIFFLNFFYYLLFMIQMIAAASLPLVTLLPDTTLKNIIISSVGVTILICQLLFNGVNFKDKAYYAKETLQILETEKFLYLNKSGKYSQNSSDDNVDLFVSEIEKCFNSLQRKSFKPKKRREIEYS